MNVYQHWIDDPDTVLYLTLTYGSYRITDLHDPVTKTVWVNGLPAHVITEARRQLLAQVSPGVMADFWRDVDPVALVAAQHTSIPIVVKLLAKLHQ